MFQRVRHGWLLLATLLAAASSPTPSGGTQPVPDHVPGEVLLQFKAEATTQERQRVLDDLGATRIRRLARIDAEHSRISRLSVTQALARYRDDPVLEFIEPNYLYRTQRVPDDPQFGLLWGLSNEGQTGGTPGADISATRVWDLTTGSEEVLVAIIDTGVDYTHPDLAANIFVNPGEIPDNGIDDDDNGFVDDLHGWDFANNDADPMDDHGHGTHVAGTVGAVGDNGFGISGVNWRVKLLPLKFLSAEGTGSTSAAIKSIDYAISMGARIMNNSWGGHGFSQALRLAIERADAADILFAAAAGNSTSSRNTDIYPFYPASYESRNIVSVAATDHDDELAGFSHFGPTSVDLAAPGVDIFSTYPGESYAFLEGTSMATPHVVGALALIMGRFPEIGGRDARRLLLDNVDEVEALSGRMVTGGRLNAYRPLSDPDETPPAAISDLVVVEPESHRVDLVWTASGDDGASGTASRYEVRYSTSPIDETSFQTAQRPGGAPKPQPAGTPQQMRIEGLSDSTTYYFAIKALDEFGNASSLSNPAVATTLGPPHLRVTPGSFGIDLFTGESATRELILHNDGVGELIFATEVDPLDHSRSGSDFGTPAIAAQSAANSGKKEVTDTTAADGTRFSYHEFDAPGGHYTGIHRLLGDARPRYIGFWIRSGSASANDAYFVLRDSTGAETIFFYATDSGTFYVNADVGGNGVVPYTAKSWYHVEFRNIDFGTKSFDYLVDGKLIQAAVPFRWSHVAELQRLDLYSFESGAEAWWDEILLSTDQPPIPVTVQPPSGVVPAGESLALTVTLDAGGLNGDDYRTEIRLRGNDPLLPLLAVPVELRVTGAPDLALSAEDADFGQVLIGASSEIPLTLLNRGTDTLSVQALQVDHPDFWVEDVPFSLAPDERREVVLRFKPGSLGRLEGRLTVHSNDPDQPAAIVTLHGVGLLPPDVRVEPDALFETLFSGEQAVQALTLSNPGLSDLHWELVFPPPGEPDLERTLLGLDRGYRRIVDDIPERYNFSEGVSGQSIIDGGSDMYDQGNLLSTDVAQFVQYSDGRITESVLFGAAGRYFTRKFPGLFVLAADLDRVDRFVIEGDLGSFGGEVDGGVVETRINGVKYRGFVKRVHGTNRPSVNHLIVVAADPQVEQRFSLRSESDFHELFNLSRASRLYYLLFAGQEGFYYDDDAVLEIMARFLAELPFSPDWLAADPIAGSLPPSQSVDLTVRFDATGLSGGPYMIDLGLISDAPGREELIVPVRLDVTAAPDIELPEQVIDFGVTFIGSTRERELGIVNNGAAPLNILGADIDRAEFTSDGAGLTVPAGESRDLLITFRPELIGSVQATLTLRTDDPDEAEIVVALTAEASPPPEIAVIPSAFEEELPSGTVVERILTIQNLAGSDLVFKLEVSNEAPGTSGSSSATTTPVVAGAAGSPAVTHMALRPAAALRSARATQDTFFRFADDFEDGNLDGWLGNDLPAAQIDSAPWSGPAGPFERSAGTGLATPAPRGPAAIVAPAVAAPLSRIQVWPPSGVVPAGESRDIVVTLSTHGLNTGQYGGAIRVDSNDPAQPEINVPVLIDVRGRPDIGTSVTDLDFGRVAQGLSSSRAVTVTNFGTGLLTVSNVVSSHPDFVPNVSGFSLAPGASRGVVVTFSPGGTGPVEGELVIHSDSARAATRIELAGEGFRPPSVQLSPPDGVLGRQLAGEITTQTLTLGNSGAEELEFQVDLRPVAGSVPLERVVLYLDDVEQGPAGWTTEVYANHDLWHRTVGASHSTATSWWCGVEGQQDYATGGRVGSALISPPLDLRGVRRPIQLRFHERYQTEPVWDQCMVDLSTDGGITWVNLRGSYGSAPSGDSNGWRVESLDLTPFAERIVRVRFYLETFDGANNAFPGWFIDDVSVTAATEPWVNVAPAQGDVAPRSSRDLQLTFDARRFRPPGLYEAILAVDSNDPFRPRVEVPARLEVQAAPHIAFPGAPVLLESVRAFDEQTHRTLHRFEGAAHPGGMGTVLLRAEGAFGTAAATATASAEAFVLGAAGGSGPSCGAAEQRFELDLRELEALAADGVMEFEVRNSPAVEPDCPANRHLLQLSYPVRVESLDFGELHIGERRTLPLVVANTGDAALTLHAVVSNTPSVTVEADGTQVPAHGSLTLQVTWEPAASGALDAQLVVVSDDPLRPSSTIALLGSAREPLEQIELEFFGLDFRPKRPGTRGLVEAALQLPWGYWSRDVVLPSVSIHGLPAETEPVASADTNGDGIDELILYFDAERLIETLPRSSIVEIEVTGEVRDRALFRGSIVVRGVSEIKR